MSDRHGPPNPFYVVLLVASSAFVLTALGYLISPVVQQQARELPQEGPGSASRALAGWLERRAPEALGAEVGVMVVAGLLAMATDRGSLSRRGMRRSPPEASAEPRPVKG